MPLFTSGAAATTAVTDLINVLLALVLGMLIQRTPDSNVRRQRVWMLFFALFLLSSALGAYLHGLVLPQAYIDFWWGPLVLLMYATASCFLLILCCEPEYRSYTRRAMLCCAVLFAALMVIFHQLEDLNYWRLKLFFIYAAFCLGSGGIGYFRLWQKNRAGSGRILLAVGLQILGGILQGAHLGNFTFIWSFNYNGTAHLLMSLSLLLFYAAYKRLCAMEQPA